MKKTTLATLILFVATNIYSATATIDIDEINQNNIDEVAYIFNYNLNILYDEKQEKDDFSQTEPRFYVSDLGDPEKADEIAYIMNEDFDDLWRNKLDVDGSTGYRKYTIVDWGNPDMLLYNLIAINENFDDLQNGKAERN